MTKHKNKKGLEMHELTKRKSMFVSTQSSRRNNRSFWLITSITLKTQLVISYYALKTDVSSTPKACLAGKWTHGIGFVKWLIQILAITKQPSHSKVHSMEGGLFWSTPSEGTPTKNINTVAPFPYLGVLCMNVRPKRILDSLSGRNGQKWVTVRDAARSRRRFGSTLFTTAVEPQPMWDDTLMMSGFASR